MRWRHVPLKNLTYRDTLSLPPQPTALIYASTYLVRRAGGHDRASVTTKHPSTRTCQGRTSVNTKLYRRRQEIALLFETPNSDALSHKVDSERDDFEETRSTIHHPRSFLHYTTRPITFSSRVSRHLAHLVSEICGEEVTNSFIPWLPKLRDTARIPKTRFLNTKPPAAITLSRSEASSALWS